MTGSKGETCEPFLDGSNLDDLAAAWIALWQDELTALAGDPEVVAAWRQAFGLAATWWRAVQDRPPDDPAAAPWPAPAGAAPGAGAGDPLGGADAARVRAGLAARIDDLERRLATLERGAAGGRADRRQPRRRRPPA